MNFGIKKLVLLLLVTFFLFVSARIVHSQTDTPTPTPAQDNTQAINDLQNKINAAKAQKQTYSTQIELIGNQIKLTEYKIEATQEQITSVTLDIDTTSKKIASLQGTLDTSIAVLINRIIATYEVGTIQPFQILLTSNNASDFFSRLNYLKLAQAHDKQLIYDTQQAKVDYSNQKTILEDKKKQLANLQQQLQTQTTQLNQEKQVQQQLLATTEAQIAAYQAQLSALQNFARSRIGPGGQSIPHQDLSDGWGKYYNQRDANWGNNFIGLSNMQVWEVGCLMTSYAMVVTHYGGSITPADVASNVGNFAGGSAYFNLPGPSANGHSASDISMPSLDDLRNKLNSGNSIIAGLSYDGGPIADHWVVLRSVNGDSFNINDPLYEGAMNVPLNDHYSGLKIVEARVYN
ncbi:MAG TPA: C39 family peptidase [Patescibacteria group bacterium]|jgi:peptidoglycan hydrolase CwlO-like protein|nr:C39 family peptidase [Patescibacteria group bacterium]